MDKNSALRQLMEVRMDGIMDEIAKADEEYRGHERKSEEYFNTLVSLHLPEDAMILIDRCVSEHNASGSRYGKLAYLPGFSDCMEMILSSSRSRL